MTKHRFLAIFYSFKMVTKTLEGEILKTGKDTKHLCGTIRDICKEIKDITDKMMGELKDLSQKQDYLITNLRDEYYRVGQEYYADNPRDYYSKD